VDGILCGGVAQRGEHLLCKQGVVGSIPITSTGAGAWQARGTWHARVWRAAAAWPGGFGLKGPAWKVLSRGAWAESGLGRGACWPGGS
jgi:hypothetical protein